MLQQGYQCTRRFLEDYVNKQKSLVVKIDEEDSAVHSSSSCHDTILSELPSRSSTTENHINIIYDTSNIPYIDEEDSQSTNQQTTSWQHVSIIVSHFIAIVIFSPLPFFACDDIDLIIFKQVLYIEVLYFFINYFHSCAIVAMILC